MLFFIRASIVLVYLHSNMGTTKMCVYAQTDVCVFYEEKSASCSIPQEPSTLSFKTSFLNGFWLTGCWPLGDWPASSRNPPDSSSITLRLQLNTQNFCIDNRGETEVLILTMQGLPSPLNYTFLRLILIFR